MNTKHLVLSALWSAFTFSNVSAQFVETFDGGFDHVWETDRFEPFRFLSVPDFTATGRVDILQLGINSDDHQAGFADYDSIGFTNTQGRKTAVAVSGAWSVSAEVYISPEMLTGTIDWRTDFWTRNSPTGLEANASYWIIGASNINIGPNTNPSRIPSFEIWTGTTGWLEIGAPIATSGWYEIEIEYDGVNARFYVDGVLGHTEVATAAPNLTNLFLQGANLPPASSPTSDHREYYYYDNITAVPEPSTYAALLGLATLGLVMLRRRLRRRV